MTVQQYLEARGESQSAFAKRVSQFTADGDPISQRTISRICAGEGCNAATALAIIRASHDEPTPGGGTVSLEDLVIAKAA